MLRIRVGRWNPSRFKELGRGGEAAVFRLRNDTAAKVFLLPNAIEFAESTELQEAARLRIKEMQIKLFEFPKGLPEELVVPNGVLVNNKDQVFGYVMPFVDGTPLDKFGRTSSLLTPSLVSRLLARLHDAVSALHAQGVIVGDFNENNIIVAKQTPYLIDADSMQFGSYRCRSFMPRFTAPEILRSEKPKISRGQSPKSQPPPSLKMVAPHSELTDWYSFLVIAMRLITFTDPYGGVVKNMDFPERFAKRITVFDKRVIYPLIARPIKDVPRPILEVFFRVFHRGERFVPDKDLFGPLLQQKNGTSNQRRKNHVKAET
ncbi:MAG: hypothetical protein AAB455_03180 [Patescibacteria group bacterium]